MFLGDGYVGPVARSEGVRILPNAMICHGSDVKSPGYR